MSAGNFATARRGSLTTLEINEAEALRAKGWSWQNIARNLGRCESDVKMALDSGRAVVVRLPPPPVPPPANAQSDREMRRLAERNRRLTAMWKDGVALDAIAEALSLSRERVKQLRVSLGLEPRGKPRVYVTWTPKMDEQVRREYVVGGKSAAMVAHEMGLSRCAVIGRAHRLGYSRAIASEPSA